jgi:hypothetical protein
MLALLTAHCSLLAAELDWQTGWLLSWLTAQQVEGPLGGWLGG